MAINVILVLVLSYAAIVGAMWLFQRRLMYVPDKTPPSRREAGVPEMRDVLIQGENGPPLLSWYRPALRPEKPTLIYFQGNAGNLTDRGDKARPYLDRDMGVLLVGYRGYGGNPGRPSERGLYDDARAALAFVRRQGVPLGKCVIYGESLGTGVAVQTAWACAAEGDPVGAVVLEAPFTSMGDAGRHRYPFLPVRTLVRDRYDNVSKIARARAPVCIVHGTADPTVPFGHGVRLYGAAAAPKTAVWVRGGDHGNLYDFSVQDEILSFIDAYFPGCVSLPLAK